MLKRTWKDRFLFAFFSLIISALVTFGIATTLALYLNAEFPIPKIETLWAICIPAFMGGCGAILGILVRYRNGETSVDILQSICNLFGKL